jgi:hypothetical protein
MADNKNNIGVPGKPEIAGEDDQTVKFPKKDIKATPRVSLGASAEGKEVKPSDKTTISPAGGAAAPGQSKGRKTIKLKPITGDSAKDDNVEETISMPRDTVTEEETSTVPPLKRATPPPTSSENLDDESTVRIQKPKMTKPAHPIPDVTAPAPGNESKQTVKLRPPSNDGGKMKATAAAASKRTIKLAPQGDKQNASAAPKPSAPTVKMPEPKPQSTQSSKKTLTLKKDSAPPPPSATQSGASAPPPSATTTSGRTVVTDTDDKSANPGPILTIAAVLATLCMIYYVWAVAGQWAEQYKEVKDAKVPGLSGAVQPPR